MAHSARTFVETITPARMQPYVTARPLTLHHRRGTPVSVVSYRVDSTVRRSPLSPVRMDGTVSPCVAPVIVPMIWVSTPHVTKLMGHATVRITIIDQLEATVATHVTATSMAPPPSTVTRSQVSAPVRRM